jgi:LuxR family maltose regulon positive regulatory protein
VSCLAQLGFASKIHPFAVTQERCREAIAAAGRHGWGTEPVIAPALLTLAASMIYTGDLDEGERFLQRAERALEGDTGPGIRLLTHIVGGMLQAGRGRLPEAAGEFGAAERLRSQLTGSHALASQVTGWLLAIQARLGMTAEARAALAALDDERAASGEAGNARAAICLADGDPAGALDAVRDVLDGAAPVIGYLTVVESHLLAGQAHRALGDQRAANQAAERALALAEPDGPVLPFMMTDARELLETLPRHETAHAALLTGILDIMDGASPAPSNQHSYPQPEELSPGELRVLRYLPTNLSRLEIARDLSISPNTVGTHIRSIYAKLGVRDRSAAVQRARELRLLAAGRSLTTPSPASEPPG